MRQCDRCDADGHFLVGGMYLTCQKMPQQRQVWVAFPLCHRTVSQQHHQPFPHWRLHLFTHWILYSRLHQNKCNSTKNDMALIVRTIPMHLGCAALAPTTTVKCAVSSIKPLLDRGASKKPYLSAFTGSSRSFCECKWWSARYQPWQLLQPIEATYKRALSHSAVCSPKVARTHQPSDPLSWARGLLEEKHQPGFLERGMYV
jgi:hypothetical protein